MSSDCGVMAPKKAAVEGKKKRKKILLETKQEIIRRHEQGMRLTDLAREYRKSTSTISTILKDKDKIVGRAPAKGVTRISSNRPQVLEDVEKLLLIWIREKECDGDTVNEAMICAKARALYAELIAQRSMTSEELPGFRASKGWFDNFKHRSGIHSVVRHGEAASFYLPAAEDFATEFLKSMTAEGYLPEQVFNCDETGLFWKKMPNRTFLTQEESRLPGHKPMKDRLTLLFCANASGDLKIKPLLVYHSETPRAFKKHMVDKSKMGVFWRSNSKLWVTRVLFVEWTNLVFGPAVKHYLLEKKLPLKAVLLMENTPAHPAGLEEDFADEFKFIRVMFLPPNTSPLIQPMNQQVISNFKKLYTRELFRRCFEMTDGSGISLRDYWKDHFDIVSCLQLIKIAWDGMSQQSLNSAWFNLWPDCVVAPASESSAPAGESAVLQEIVSLGQTMGLEVSEEDVSELVKGHDAGLYKEDLLELHREMQEEQVASTEEVMSTEPVSTSELRELCQKWDDVRAFAERHHSDPSLAYEFSKEYEYFIMSQFKGTLMKCMRQQTLDSFLVKRLKQDPSGDHDQPSTSSSS